ncbi:MAG TPA: DUF1629 domain-containing protein [Myxococcaceae bacterium]|nr:DUF1629 domain-containing protein [Myxococcaceae bacterium]
MKRYFKMNQDLYVPGRWYLSDPTDNAGRSLDWVFDQGRPVTVDGPVKVAFNPFAERGRPVDYTELAIDIVPVVHARIATVLSQLAPSDVQLIPAKVGDHPEPFYVVNVLRVQQCIDDDRSLEVEYYTPDCEEVFRDRVGQYRSVIGLRIDPAKAGNAKIFRTWGWVAVIVSEEIKSALESIKTVGVKFEEV